MDECDLKYFELSRRLKGLFNIFHLAIISQCLDLTSRKLGSFSQCSCKLIKLLFWSDGCFAWRRTWNWNDFEQLAELLLDTYITVNPVRSGWPPLTVSVSHFKTCTHHCCTPCHVVHNSLLWARIKLLLWVEITWNCLQDFFTLFPWRSQCCVVPVPTASPPQRPVSEQLASRRPDWLPWW